MAVITYRYSSSGILSMLRRTLPLFPDFESESRGIEPARLPTNTTTYRHPVHRWYNFIAGFSPEFVEICLDKVNDPDGILLDPFAGCATAPLTACQMGLRGIGYEPHPVLARIARAKLVGGSAVTKVADIEAILHAGLKQPRDLDILASSPARFLSALFPKESLNSLLGAREFLLSSEFADDDLAFLMLSRVVDQCSHSQTDGIYKAPTSRKKPEDPLAAVTAIASMVRGDLKRSDVNALGSRATIHEASSIEMSHVPDESISIVVTSPPYLNNFDFAEMTRMLLYFWGLAESWGDITVKVRSKLIVNTTTALKGHKTNQQSYRDEIPIDLHEHLASLKRSLREQRSVRAGKKEYDYLVYPYFGQLTQVLRECHRCMKPDATIHIMIADAALYGIHIDAPQIVQRILDDIGFRRSDCVLVRRRGHRWILKKRDGSKYGLGEYHVHAVK